jgi:hypothetical protein
MKNITLAIIFYLIGTTFSLFGQSFKLDATGTNDMRLRTSTTDRITISNTGNVGVGTSSPSTKFDINGDLSLSKSIRINVTGTQNALARQGASRIFIDVVGLYTLNGIAGGTDGAMVYIYTGISTTLVVNNLSTAASQNDRIAITGGNGGSETITSKGGILLIYEGGAVNNWRVCGMASISRDWNRRGNNATNPDFDFIGTLDSKDFVMRTDNTERVRITATGNVSIGSDTPPVNTKLFVSGGASGVSPSASTRTVFESNTSHYLAINAPDNEETGLLFGRPTGGGASGGIIYDAAKNLNFRTNNNLTRMSILSGGNVGIGTSVPSSKFHVANGLAGVTNFGGMLATFESAGNSLIGLFTPSNGISGIYFGNVEVGSPQIIGGIGGMALGHTGTSQINISTSNSLGIGVSPSVKLHVDGDFALKKKKLLSGNGGHANETRDGASVISIATPANGGGGETLGGLTAGVDGLIVHLYPVQGTSLTILHESTTSTALNRIITHTGANISLTNDGGVTLMYDESVLRWRVIAIAN